MDTVLFAGSKAAAAALSKVLVPQYYAGLVCAPSAARARQLAARQDWGLILISAPLPDEAAADLAGDLAQLGAAGVLLLDDAPPGGSLAGVVTLQKPVNRLLLENTLQVLAATGRRLAALREENRALALKLEEARLVGRAKCALVAYRQMTEEEAHRYIEKQAMDSRLPRREVARELLQVFEGEG